MNPKLKTALIVLLIVAAFVGVIMLGVWGLAHVFANALIEAVRSGVDQAVNAAPTSSSPILDPPPQAKNPADAALGPLLIVSASLFGLGMILLKQFEYTNKKLKALGFILVVIGAIGCLLGPYILAIFF